MEKKDREALLVMAGTIVAVAALAAGNGFIALVLVASGITFALS